MTFAHNLGFPRIGRQRELKKALDDFWAGRLPLEHLLETGRQLRAAHWRLQQQAGIDLVPVGDFAWYDHMLNMTALLGATPRRFQADDQELDLAGYFALARGTETQPAMELTKWFDTNYHYIVPEFTFDTTFRIASRQLFSEIAEAQALGIRPKAVLVGPLTYLYLGKEKEVGLDRLALLPKLLPVYRQVLEQLAAQGVEWVQVDEPALALDLPPAWLEAYPACYQALAGSGVHLLLATYFGSVATHANLLRSLPVAGLHLDLARAPGQLSAFLDGYPADKILSLGLIDGRNVWRADLRAAWQILQRAQAQLGGRLWVAPSCSLLHAPIDLAQETDLDAELKNWLAFAVQKLQEVAVLKQGLSSGEAAITPMLAASDAAVHARRTSPRIHNAAVQARVAALTEADARRHSPYAIRHPLQQACYRLPLFPTTTIGSFPQTDTIRQTRAAYRAGRLSTSEYFEKIGNEVRIALQRQQALGLDVLVHGEAERNDMVEYFGEQLQGFAFTRHGWVQSFGSRCVKPPIIYGDVARPKPMTVGWAHFAQAQTDRPVKGMLTGPVTLLQWSFVRDDQPRRDTALQIALAIRDEVIDLEKAGIGIIQIDEPAIREGLPLQRAGWEAYLAWAGYAFRIAASGVRDETQIHTHMCYSEFNDILPAIAALDADVITIETSRSQMELLDGFAGFHYPNDIGPGVYDIHSPRLPTVVEIEQLLHKAAAVIEVEKIWVNPDCGLKTRTWAEVEAALRNMVAAARNVRAQYAGCQAAEASRPEARLAIPQSSPA